MDVRFIVCPPAKINKLTSRLALKAKRPQSQFIVDNRKLLPHITLFHLQIRKDRLPEVIKITADLVKNFSALNLKLVGYTADKQGWLVIDIKLTKQLERLRKNLFFAVKEYNRTRYMLKKFYHPHITLTKYNDSKTARLVKRQSLPQRENFRSNFVAVGLSDKHFQVYKVIKKFKLKG